jgi:tetratricopeptide (TPR) repeat protein
MLLILLLPGPAAAASDWAKGDRAFKAGRFAQAESLYARRLKKKAPAEVRVNRAVAQALKGDADNAGQELERLTAREGRVGREAGYNFGTIMGQKDRFEPALGALRKVLERDPTDEDARWNYELLMRREKDDEKPPPDQPQPKPRPSSSGGGGGGGQQGSPPPAPNPGSAGQPQPQGGSPPPQSRGMSGGMNRTQAEQLLGALQEMARIEQQRRRKVRVMRERQSRDW